MLVSTAAGLTPAQLSKLERIRHYRTRYEIEITIPGAAPMLVCYSDRKNLAGLCDALCKRWAPITRAANVPHESAATRVKRAAAYAFDNGATVRFSGRTQRDAIMSGELAYIGNGEA
jgi:hypothetical protein